MRQLQPFSLATLFLLSTAMVGVSHAQPLSSDEARERSEADDTRTDIVVTGQTTPSQYSLEEASVGGFGPIKISEIPQSVQSLSSDFIRDQGVLSIAQLISNAVPSASGTLARTTPFSTTFTRIRGQDALVYRDGLRDVDFADIDTSALVSIASVEVLKGPSGLIFGSGGPGGVINLVTKRPTKEAQANFTTTVGTRGVFIVSGDVSTPLGAGFGIRVTGELERSNSFIRFSEIERDNFAAVLGFDNDGPLRARLRVERQSSRDDGAMNNVGLPAVGTIRTNVNGVFQIDPRVRIDRDAYFGEPALDFQRSSGTIASAVVEYDFTDAIGLELAGRYTRVNFEQNNVQNLGVLNPITFILPRARLRELDLESNQYNVRGLLRAAFDTGALSHTLSVGVEYFQQDIVITNLEALRAGIPNIDVRAPSFLTSFPTARELVFNRDTKDDLVEFFIHDVVRLGEKLTLTAALRYSSNQFDDEEAIPAQPATSTTPAVRARAAATGSKLERTVYQLGATYAFTPALSVFAGYNTGFDANDAIGRTMPRAGQRFEPEFFEQFEAGVKTKQFFGVTASLAGFVLNRKNLLLADPTDSNFSVQVGAQRTQGFEADVLINPIDGLNIRLGYAFLDSEITEDTNPAQIGRLQPNTPRHTLNGFASYLIGSGALKNLQLGAGFVFVDKVFASISNLNERPSFATAQFNLAYTLGRIRLDATLANAFDKRFFIPRNENTVAPGEPRQFTLRASVLF